MHQRVGTGHAAEGRLHSPRHDDQLLFAIAAPQKRAQRAFGQIPFVRCQILQRYVGRPVMYTVELGIVRGKHVARPSYIFFIFIGI